MKARKDQGFTQETLGVRVGTSQNVVSLIEKGPPEGIGSSKFILPICRVLSIPPPQHYEDDEVAAWSQLGSLLRHKNMRRFKATLDLVKSMVDEEEATERNPESPANRK